MSPNRIETLERGNVYFLFRPKVGEENPKNLEVDGVSKTPEEIENRLDPQIYETKTRGTRHLPAVRPIGEGVYRIVRHEDHTHFVYALELPKKTGEAQTAFNIEERASYIISVKNPEKGSPSGAGLPEEQEAHFPRWLQEKFRDRRFCEADPPDFLNYEGTEFVLISAAEDVSEELGIKLHPEDESGTSADIFNELKMEKSVHPLKPLSKGEWD
ncbi:MAG TPA: hypothetical protein VE689_00440 [Candidatus Udaeobacter sp.]|nr:hypothetical protein [Candidatus Udaeobacter sp.]